MTNTISAEEWQVRCDLAACYHLFVKFGWTDLIFTHLSARVPGEPNHYLMNPFGLLFNEITASNLLKVDFDGNVVSGDYPYNQAGHEIHTAILKARPDVNVALHSHTRAGAAVSAMGEGLLNLSQHAIEISELVCYHPYTYAPDSDLECERLAEDIGDKWLMIMHNHGLLAAGRTVAEAFYYLYILEAACKIQVDVLSASNNPVLPDPEAVASLTRHTAIDPNGPHGYTDVNWAAMLRQLKRDGVEWKR
jgi:ribulose-5-phosphate 4-epimerase/fuculose-1-phosphate aldolase